MDKRFLRFDEEPVEVCELDDEAAFSVSADDSSGFGSGLGFNRYLYLETGLWAAVIRQAVMDLSSSSERMSNNARRFFTDKQNPMLEIICEDFLDIDPQIIISTLKRRQLL